MRTKEECTWCMSTQHIVREVKWHKMPEEFKHRCSACHEMWYETHRECDVCERIVDTDEEIMHYDKLTNLNICDECKDKHGYI